MNRAKVLTKVAHCPTRTRRHFGTLVSFCEQATEAVCGVAQREQDFFRCDRL
jgi:hypothetical protein